MVPLPRIKNQQEALGEQEEPPVHSCRGGFRHALSTYVGCGIGKTTCGMYCYAQFLPNWALKNNGANWGEAVHVETNAATLLASTLERMKPERRSRLRIFMSSTTDPYQPAERTHQVTRQCLEVFARYADLDLLVIQTRSPLVARDLELLSCIPYAWLSMTIETDGQSYLRNLRGGPPLIERWKVVRAARDYGLPVQITISPSLPYTSVEAFGSQLLNSGAQRLVVDTFVDGDGSGGRRTTHSLFAHAQPDWKKTEHALRLYDYLLTNGAEAGSAVGWSVAGFCGIEPRKFR